jgi:acetylornithine deacetylase/succinyl-diaminopimelate desuccinylase-like protein
VHSSFEAQIDSPSWHLVQALNTLVQADGHTPAVAGFFAKVRPLSARQKQILESAIPKRNEAIAKKGLGVDHWFKDESFHDAEVRLVTQPTINIEGLVGGYTGPGGKTILPHPAVAKIDMRLVPGCRARDLELLKQHLATRLQRHRSEHERLRPPETDPDSKLVAQIAAYKQQGVEPMFGALAGSCPA